MSKKDQLRKKLQGAKAQARAPAKSVLAKALAPARGITATSSSAAKLKSRLGGGASGGKAIISRKLAAATAGSEKTGYQWTYGSTDLATTLVGLGISMPAYRGDYQVYRMIRGNPTVAMARAAALSPVKFADFSVEPVDAESTDVPVPEEMVKCVEKHVRQMWRHYTKHALNAVDYGWQPFEKVWTIKNGEMCLELKPLAQDLTEVRVFDNGQTELRQSSTHLGPDKHFIFTYDDEYDGVFGRSRLENIRESAWAPWKTVTNQMHRYFEKAAGIVPMLNYPMGVSTDKAGAERNNYDIAVALLEELRKGKAIAMPWMLQPWAEEALTKNIDFGEMMSWRISFLEVPVGHGSEYKEAAQYYDQLMCRGYLVPERAVIEGQHGTKAEAGEHANVALAVAEDLFNDICEGANRGWLPELISVNYGAQWKDKIKIKPSPLQSEERQLAKDIVFAVLTNPQNIDMLLHMVGFEAMIDQMGLPKGDGTAPDVLATSLGEKLRTAAGKNLLGKKLRGEPTGSKLPGDGSAKYKLGETLNGQ